MFKLLIECTKDIDTLKINFTDGTSVVTEHTEHTEHKDNTQDTEHSKSNKENKDNKNNQENKNTKTKKNIDNEDDINYNCNNEETHLNVFDSYLKNEDKKSKPKSKALKALELPDIGDRPVKIDENLNDLDF